MQANHELLTAEEVADFLRMNAEYFRNKYRNGKMLGFPDAVKHGSRRLWWRDEVIGWVNRQREGARSERETEETEAGQA